MIKAPQAAILVPAKIEGRPPVRTELVDQTDITIAVAKRDKVFAKQLRKRAKDLILPLVQPQLPFYTVSMLLLVFDSLVGARAWIRIPGNVVKLSHGKLEALPKFI